MLRHHFGNLRLLRSDARHGKIRAGGGFLVDGGDALLGDGLGPRVFQDAVYLFGGVLGQDLVILLL